MPARYLHVSFMGLVPLNLGEQEKQFSLETTKLSLSLSIYIYRETTLAKDMQEEGIFW
jgi:hypothetical protein